MLSSIDPNSGFCSKTKIYHSLRPQSHLPPHEKTSISVTDYIFSLLNQNNNATVGALIDATTGNCISYPQLIHHVKTLAAYLKCEVGLEKGDTAFIISPNSIHIPILYLALLSIGVIISPSNPLSSDSEISRQIGLSKAVITFSTRETCRKLSLIRCRNIVIDSDEFESMINAGDYEVYDCDAVDVLQSNTAAILYSSGTTGRVKGVVLTHRNFIASLAVVQAAVRNVRVSPAVALCTVPYFHAYGLMYVLRGIAVGMSVVSMKRFDLGVMMRGIEEFRVTHLVVVPSVVVAMVNDTACGYDLRSLEVVSCGGAPIAEAVIERFRRRFHNVPLAQGYGMTETTSGICRILAPIESGIRGATGRIDSNCQAKIVDPDNGICLPPFKQGELWVRGPSIMKGYVDDEEATASILDSEGWLRTGDLCYFDSGGFLFYVDRIKELIKYKGYQVAPAELEHLLQSHPDIIDAAVIPYPDEEAGQIPMAFVVRRLGSTIDESQIKDFVAEQVAPYKKIRRVSFINSLPKNAPGKVLRKELIKLALSSTTSKL